MLVAHTVGLHELEEGTGEHLTLAPAVSTDFREHQMKVSFEIDGTGDLVKLIERCQKNPLGAVIAIFLVVGLMGGLVAIPLLLH